MSISRKVAESAGIGLHYGRAMRMNYTNRSLCDDCPHNAGAEKAKAAKRAAWEAGESAGWMHDSVWCAIAGGLAPAQYAAPCPKRSSVRRSYENGERKRCEVCNRWCNSDSARCSDCEARFGEMGKRAAKDAYNAAPYKKHPVCVICGDPISGRSNASRCVSCGHRYNGMTNEQAAAKRAAGMACEVCGKPTGGDRRRCRKCAERYGRASIGEARRAELAKAGEAEPHRCGVCGEEFAGSRVDQKYCADCRKRYGTGSRETMLARRAELAKVKRCAVCGAEYHSRSSTRRRCDSCMVKYRGLNAHDASVKHRREKEGAMKDG